MKLKKLIDVYPYKLTPEKKPLFLILKRAEGKIYEGQWRMIGGKVENSETRWEAAVREFKEETNLAPELFWTVPTINHFYEAGSDLVHIIPAFGAQISKNAEPVLDGEHSRFKWIEAEQSELYIYWPEQIRIIHLINKILLKGKILKEWTIPPK